MNVNFDRNEAAKNSFLRAFTSWRCNTLINWTLGSVTSNNFTVKDDENNIRFFNPGELPDGVLGVCWSYYSSCNGGTTWFVSELDIEFAGPNEFNWQYGPPFPSSTEIDFESVALHELGHGQQLAHTNNLNSLMNATLAPGEEKRTIDNNSLEGALLVMSQSTAKNICGPEPMIALDTTGCTKYISQVSEVDFLKINQNPINYLSVNKPIEITYSLSKQAIVLLELFDSMGQRIGILENATQSSGEYKLPFNIQERGNGLYFLRLTLNNSDTKTLKIIKVS